MEKKIKKNKYFSIVGIVLIITVFTFINSIEYVICVEENTNDVELYLEGLMVGRERTPIPNIQGNLDGDFGHAMPK